MRQRGEEAHSESAITIRPDVKHLPKLVCSICGQSFYYRGAQDADCLKGSTYDPESDTYIPSGNTPAVCDECMRKLSGGPLDGKTTGELYAENHI